MCKLLKSNLVPLDKYPGINTRVNDWNILQKDFAASFPWKYLLLICQNIWPAVLFQEQNFQSHRDYYSHILTENLADLQISSAATSRDKKVILFTVEQDDFFVNGLHRWEMEDNEAVQKYMVHLLIKKFRKGRMCVERRKGRLHLLHYWKTEENKICSFYPFRYYLRLLMWDWFLFPGQQ